MHSRPIVSTRLTSCLLGLALVGGFISLSGVASQTNTDTTSLLDLHNRSFDPFNPPQHAKALVFIFLRTDCPICNRYAPEIRRLHQTYGGRGALIWLVYPDASKDEIAKHLQDYQLSIPALRDPGQVLVRRAGIRVTPEAAVFLPKGERLYRGRIDNRFVDFGRERPSATEHDLEQALSAVLSGKPVPEPVTRAVGCYVTPIKTPPR